MRIARVFKERCNPKKCNYLCIKVCPLMKTGKKVIEVDEVTKKIKINPHLCIGCGICVRKCPFNAIKIVNLPDTYNKQLVHSFGENEFKLFRFPIIKKDNIISIIGENGLGKSTTIKILTGKIIPNFGKDSIDKKEVIKFFRGSELQNYFKDLYEGKVRYAIKEQNIEELRKINKKVGEMLEEEVLKKYGIEYLKDRKFNELSGGELQKIAIIMVVENKKANYLFFDEPSAFLDIKQRLWFIKLLERENRNIILVDHDLIVVDAVSDISYIYYGEPGVYGIVSQPISTREAINQYLYGYLKRENVQIREKPIIIEGKREETKGKREIVNWKNIYVKVGNFELEAKKGEIFEEEIVGVIGENGIGKTTFAKVLAGIIKIEKGEISKKVKISYKPQYIYAKVEEIQVKKILEKVGGEKINEEFYKSHILNPLKIKDIWYKNLGNLSGGELQRVAIAICLLQDADLYILDEPTAYLDVEMRIRLARIIKDFIKTSKKSALIIDHDLNFIDYISDRIILFKGEKGKRGMALEPMESYKAINEFLKDLNITFRRDEITKRMRYNKEGSRKDLEQKAREEFLERI